jgi:predicted  nucleic acid-binding Zn-ribbon protein
MKNLMDNLLALQDLEFQNKQCSPEQRRQIQKLHQKIPTQILGHYDRLMVRGKKGLAAVRNQVCTGCHMRVPIGAITTIMHGKDIQLCENCGRYLYLPQDEPVYAGRAAENSKPAAPKPAKRKKEALVHAS